MLSNFSSMSSTPRSPSAPRGRALCGRHGLALGAMLVTLAGLSTPAHADVIPSGDVTPTVTIDDGFGGTLVVPDLPQFGGVLTGDNGRLVIGGTGLQIGGSDTGQVIVDIPQDTDPLVVMEMIIGGDVDPMGAGGDDDTDLGIGILRVIGLNSEVRVEDFFVVGGTGQGFVDLINGAKLTGDFMLDGSFTISNNPELMDGVIGQEAGSQGFVLIDGFGSVLANSALAVGHGSQGRIEAINRGRIETRGEAVIGNISNLANNLYGDGFVLLDGQGTRWNVGSLSSESELQGATGNLYVGNAGRGTLEIRNQAVVRVEADTFIGREASSFGEVFVEGRGSQIWSFDDMFVGSDDGLAAGELHIDNAATARADNSLFVGVRGLVELGDGTILAGGIGSVNNGIIRGSGNVDAVLTNGATGEIRNAAAVANIRERLLFRRELTNQGTVSSIGGEMDFQELVTNAPTGEIFGRDAVFSFREPTVGLDNRGQLLFGAGVSDVFGNVTNAGELAVGHDGIVTFHGTVTNTTGEFNVLGGGVVILSEDLVMASTATLSLTFLDLGLNQPTDPQLQVAGELTLGGFLDLTFGGFTPELGDEFLVASAGSIVGDFDVISDPFGFDLVPEIRTEALQQQLVLVVSADTIFDADFNQNGSVDDPDFAIWEENFGTLDGATNATADAMSDGDVDGFDFLVWQRQFGAAPSVIAAAAVPEPTAACLALVGVLLGCPRRRARK